MPSKFHNTPTNGSASKLEATRKWELEMMQRAGLISDLEFQVKYELIPPQRDARTHKLIEHNCCYIADFRYRDENGEIVVEDTKGFKTKDYVIKRKLMLWRYDIRIREICNDKKKKGGSRYKRQTMARKSKVY